MARVIYFREDVNQNLFRTLFLTFTDYQIFSKDVNRVLDDKTKCVSDNNMRYRLMSLSANNIYASTCRFVGMANSGFILIKNTTEFCCLPF